MRAHSTPRSNTAAKATAKPTRSLLASTVLLALLSLQALPQTAHLAWAQRNQPSIRAGEPVTLNFENADIEAVARAMATITGQNVVIDPRVSGTLNLVTEQPVSAQTAFTQFLVALRMQGYTVVESAGLYKVVPEAEGKLQSGTVNVSGGSFGSRPPAGGQIVTQIFKLNFENANSLVPTLRPLISPNNTITVNPGTNSLVITDYADNLQRIAKIIAALDVSEGSDIEIIPLENAVASDLIPMLNSLISGDGNAANGLGANNAGSGVSAAGQGYRTTLLADTRSNSIVVRAANPARIAQVRRLVEQLDRPPAPGSSAEYGNIHVVFLKNADAIQMAQTLRAALSASQNMANSANGTVASSNATPSTIGANNSNGGLSSSSSSLSSDTSSGSDTFGQGGISNLGAAQNISTGGFIQADPNTNSLIITAPDPLYRQIRAVIDRLDGRRAQVLVESLVVEVNADKAAEFGIQWQAGFGSGNSSNVGYLGTNYQGNGGSGTNILDLALAAALGYTGASSSTVANALNGARPGTGINLGVAHNYGGTYVLGFLARFLQGSGEGNVLSTPNLLTLDNQEARIVIGQNVPFVTGQYTSNNTSNGSVNPFQTIERQDVGISLRVKPQINENGTVKLAVVQEVSDIVASTANNVNGPTTSKRLIETNILVDDGGIVVLGGLLQDQYAESQEKVPLLGDIPFIGNAFRSESRSHRKTNLMVFLRPVVVRDAASSDALALERYDMIRNDQSAVQPSYNFMLNNVRSAPQLPQLPADPAADQPADRNRTRQVPSLTQLSATPAVPARSTIDIREVPSGEERW